MISQETENNLQHEDVYIMYKNQTEIIKLSTVSTELSTFQPDLGLFAVENFKENSAALSAYVGRIPHMREHVILLIKYYKMIQKVLVAK